MKSCAALWRPISYFGFGQLDSQPDIPEKETPNETNRLVGISFFDPVVS